MKAFSLRKHVLGSALALASALAAASPCSSILSSFQMCNGSASCENTYLSQHPECFGGSATTATTSINATAFTQAGAISQALSARIRQNSQGPRAALDSASGLAAGGAQQWNVWASHSDNSSKISYTNSATTTTRNNNRVGTTVLGGDIALSPKMALGVSAAFDRGNGSGQVAAGAPNSTGSNGYMIAPYLGYQLSKEMAVDLSAGLGNGEFSSGTVKSDADRWFATANLSYSQWMKNWQVTGKLSYLHGEEKYADSKNSGTTVAGTASKNTLDQARIGVQAAYWMDSFMPYLGLAYSSDMHRSATKAAAVDPLGRSAFILSTGVNFFSLTSKITGGIAYEQESGRSNSKNETLMANINFRF